MENLEESKESMRIRDIMKEMHEFVKDPNRTGKHYKEKRARYHELAVQFASIPTEALLKEK